MSVKIVFFLLLATCILTSCSSNSLNDESVILKTNITEPNKFRFSGKGAGAGMMLMSSMGPVGVAIGVAIDEGIANDIDKAAKAGGFDIESLVLQQLSMTLKEKATNVKDKQAKEIIIDIVRYGFIIVPGGDDIITPQLHLNIKLNGNRWLSVKYPEQLSEEQRKTIHTDTLEIVKSDSQAINGAFEQAMLRIVHVIQEIN